MGDASTYSCLASAVTVLLRHSIERIGPFTDISTELVRKLLVGDRDYLVLRLRQITNGNRVAAILVCPNPQCGKNIDADFDIGDIHVKQGNISSQVSTHKLAIQSPIKNGHESGDYIVNFRLPNGGDQEAMASLVEGDESKAVTMLLARCIQGIDGIGDIDERQIEKISATAREKIEKKMAELAPRVDLEMEARCPECGQEFLFPFNMARFFLDEMKINLNQLYQEVHFLAFHYKWSESDILTMTRKKRRKYLELLSEQIKLNTHT